MERDMKLQKKSFSVRLSCINKATPIIRFSSNKLAMEN